MWPRAKPDAQAVTHVAKCTFRSMSGRCALSIDCAYTAGNRGTDESNGAPSLKAEMAKRSPCALARRLQEDSVQDRDYRCGCMCAILQALKGVGRQCLKSAVKAKS